MAEKVIPFPKASERARPGWEQRREEIRERDLRRLRSIESSWADGKKGHIFAPKDRVTAAKAIGHLLAEAKLHGTSAGSIREKFGRIERYALAENVDPLSPEAKQRSAGGLMQQVRGYLKLAEILAEALDRNADDTKIEILKDTGLWTRADANFADQNFDERAQDLTMIIREMARSVIKREKLAELFDRARKIPGQWDIHLEQFRPSKMACLFQSSYEAWPVHWEEAPPLPSVPLLQFNHAEVRGPILLETTGASNPPNYLILDDSEFEGAEKEAHFKIIQEIRLCLGPTTGPVQLGAMFEMRSRVIVSFANNDETTEDLKVLPGCDFDWLNVRGGYVNIDNRWHRIKLLCNADLGDLMYWQSKPPNNHQLQLDHYNLDYLPLNEASVSYWLDRSDGVACRLAPGPRPTPQEQWYTWPHLGYDIESLLATGAIETALIEQINKIRAALDERERAWRSGAQKMARDLMEIWNDD